MRAMFIGTVVIASMLLIGGCSKKSEQTPISAREQVKDESKGEYYTCPMHPQVHQDHGGPCPICGMALVKVSAKPKAENSETTATPIEASAGQLSVAGVTKYTVGRKDLAFTVPISGRFISTREVAFQLFEADLHVVKVGLTLEGTSSASPGEKLKGQIRQIDTLLDPSSRTVRAVGVLENAPAKFIIEGSYYGEIKILLKDQLAIPEEAVLHTGKRDLAYLFSGHQLRAVPVVIGAKANGEYQLLSGLSEGDIISSGPNFLIDSEAKIRGGNDQANN